MKYFKLTGYKNEKKKKKWESVGKKGVKLVKKTGGLWLSGSVAHALVA